MDAVVRVSFSLITSISFIFRSMFLISFSLSEVNLIRSVFTCYECSLFFSHVHFFTRELINRARLLFFLTLSVRSAFIPFIRDPLILCPFFLCLISCYSGTLSPLPCLCFSIFCFLAAADSFIFL